MAIYQDVGRKREFVIPIPYKPPPSKKTLDGLFLEKLRKIRDCSLVMSHSTTRIRLGDAMAHLRNSDLGAYLAWTK